MFKTLALIGIAVAAIAATPKEKKVFTESDFAQLRFLEGRWHGKAPDGSSFFEQYDFPDCATMRSRRFADSSFQTSTDGSTVKLEGEQIVSRWGEFSWTADAVQAGFVSFRPLNAPSSFTWRKVDVDSVEISQRWVDDKGVEHSYNIPLEKMTQTRP